MKNQFPLFLILFAISFQLVGQDRFFIQLKDKNGTAFSVERPQEFLSQRSIERRQKQNIEITENDLPVSQTYLNQIAETGAEVIYTSKWLNGVLVETNASTLSEVLALSFVLPLNNNLPINARVQANSERSGINSKFLDFEDFDPGTSKNQLEMLGVDIMHREGFTGKGVLIGILDSGFANGKSLDVFQHIFAENRVLDTWDYVRNESDVYNDHSHGTNVWSCIGAKLEGQLLGTAPDASFALYTSEDVFSETKLEEANWLFAAERADSLGVDVINTSLGYTTFDNSAQNYRYEDLDGDIPLITQAADFAASKGIVVVTSAGNSGNKAWKYVGAPADGDSVLAIGAVDENGAYASFSSVGPRTDGTIKPEIAAKGLRTTLSSHQNFVGQGNGTSFASPLIAGMMANMVQAFPNLSAMELRDIIIKSASQYDSPDELLGYGIPNYSRAKSIANIENLKKSTTEEVLVFPNPIENEQGFDVLLTKDENTGGTYTVQVTDLRGRVVLEQEYTSNFFRVPLSPSKTPLGNYILKVFNEEGFYHSSRINLK